MELPTLNHHLMQKHTRLNLQVNLLSMYLVQQNTVVVSGQCMH